MSDLLHLPDIYARLRIACAVEGQLAWAQANGISPSYLNDVVCARKDPGPKILAALGVRKVTVYTTIKENVHA